MRKLIKNSWINLYGFFPFIQMKKELKVVVKLGQRKFLSVNELYKCRVVYKYGKPIASMYKNPEAQKIEAELREQLRAVDFSEYRDFLKDTPGFDVFIQFILKRNITKLDSSNLIKNFEDIWTRFVKHDLGIDNYDDSKHIKLTVLKSLIPKGESEYACLSITESTVNTRYDIFPGPEHILAVGLGPKCKELEAIMRKKAPRKNKIVYQDFPSTWSEEQERAWNEEIWKHNTVLFRLTPDLTEIQLGQALLKIDQAREISRTDEKRFCLVAISGNWEDSKKEELIKRLEWMNSDSRNHRSIVIRTDDVVELIEKSYAR